MPTGHLKLEQIHSDIRSMQATAEGLRLGSDNFPALHRNIRRIQAVLKMLELNVCDLVDLEQRTDR